jgi:hypothetical protein
MSAGYEPVFAWPAHYMDRPREGVANVDGHPHRFVADWDPIEDDYAETFSLYPIDDETLRIASEQWAIWRRWVAAPDETPPALPEDRERYRALKQQWAIKLAESQAPPRHAMATFRRVRDEFYDLPNAATLEVRWTITSPS